MFDFFKGKIAKKANDAVQEAEKNAQQSKTSKSQAPPQ
jgi:hypothetical protein